jgi:hypothetical protein
LSPPDPFLCRALRAPPRCSTEPLWAHMQPRLFPLLGEARGSDHYRMAPIWTLLPRTAAPAPK